MRGRDFMSAIPTRQYLGSSSICVVHWSLAMMPLWAAMRMKKWSPPYRNSQKRRESVKPSKLFRETFVI